MGIVAIISYAIPSFLAPYSALVEWIDFSNIFAGPTIVVFGIVLIVMAVGLVRRYRTAMALAVTTLVLLAGIQFLFFETITVAIVAVALAVWLFVQRASFDRPVPRDPHAIIFGK
jgi:phosphatidylglycerol lysyltransferase